MKYTTSILLASASWASALTQQCSGTAIDEGGNWFCGAVKQIMYEGIAGSGSFKGVTNMGENGQCDTEDVPYIGPLAPLDQDVSHSTMHRFSTSILTHLSFPFMSAVPST